VNASAAVSVSALSAGYNRLPVVHDVNLQVVPGEVVAIVGPNGAGKSSLLRCLVGQVAIYGGNIEVLDHHVRHGGPEELALLVRSGVAYISEHRSILRELSVGENLSLVMARVSAPQREERWNLAFELFPWLRDRLKQRAGVLSGGQAQMLALARAFVGGAKVVVIDEPSLGLSPLIVEEVAAHIATLARDHGAAVVVADQGNRNIVEIAGRVMVMRSGSFVSEVSAGQFLELESELYGF